MNRFAVVIIEVETVFYRFDNRVPLKFGHEISYGGETVCACVTVRGMDGRTARGYGETPLAAAWSWPSELTQVERVSRMRAFCGRLARSWGQEDLSGHPMEIGWDFLEHRLPVCLEEENNGRLPEEQMPYLAALVCCSAFDLAVYDAFGTLHGIRVFDSFNERYMSHDLAEYYTPEFAPLFSGCWPEEFLVPRNAVPAKLAACHLVGGKDLLYAEELSGEEPDDGLPILLGDWIDRDGLYNLKIKLTGNDYDWDLQRILAVGRLGLEKGIRNFTVDFNCTVKEPVYVCRMLDWLQKEAPAIYERILYVEQPFSYDLRRHPIDVHEVSARKLLLMDESAHDWRYVAMGFRLGWNGVALKTCKTLTGAILSLCWARRHGMAVMVQDLTNLRLAIIPHVLLAANAGTIMGVEVNAMQFCPDASRDAARVHPGLYRRRNGEVDLSTLGETGFGYRLEEIRRAAESGE